MVNIPIITHKIYLEDYFIRVKNHHCKKQRDKKISPYKKLLQPLSDYFISHPNPNYAQIFPLSLFTASPVIHFPLSLSTIQWVLNL